MLKNVHTVYYNSTKDQLTDHVLHTTLKTVDEQLLLLIKNNLDEQTPIMVVNAHATLPPFWQNRLCQPLVDDVQIMVVCALTTAEEGLSPLAQSFAGTLSQLDQAVYLIQKPQYFPTDQLNQNCFVIRNWRHWPSNDRVFAVNNLLVDIPQNKDVIDAPAMQEVGDQHPLPAHPLSALRLTLRKLSTESISMISGGYPGLDQNPVVLHVVMDWGGGVHHWVNNFIQTQTSMNHLVLCSQGEFFRQQHGEKFVLRWQHTEGMELAQFHLSQAIKATTVKHPEYQAMLAEIIQRWGAQRLIVSSLIGHAMDCLNTGLPTLRLLHDYFPHWPSLNAELDHESIDTQYIEKALQHTKEEPFGQISASQLSHWQQHNNDLLNQNNITIVAPDESVKTNLLKLPDSSCYTKTMVIPHASQPLKPIKYSATDHPFKVLVLGRITAAKGQALLAEVIRHYSQDKGIEFVLLGAGKNGQAFVDLPHTRVVAEYNNENLTSEVSQWSPQLGLITSLTAETFSYTLSEMLAMGIPVLASAVGALKYRIHDGLNGVLTHPTVDQVTAKIDALRQDPELLLQLHEGALNTPLMSATDNKHAYLKLFEPETNLSISYQTRGLVKPPVLAEYLRQSNQTIERLDQTLQSTEQNLAEKAAWARDLNEHNQHLTENITLEKKHSERLEQTIEQQTATIAELELIKQHKELLEDRVNQLNNALEQSQATKIQLEADKAQLSGQLASMLNSRSWRFTKPLRRLTTYARHKRNAIKFRFNQLKGIPRRVSNSLKTRGVKQTALMAKNKLKKPPTPAKVTAHSIVESYQAITVNSSVQPKVSVIIPVYNHFKHTYHCLESLARLADQTPFEVIVVDDCSTDETPETIQQVSGITYHRQQQNGGFIESCNTGAQLAEGEFLLFLNNDTEVLDGWLDELVNTFDMQPDAGLVGSQLLYPDGRLQEAGGIVFNDASGWNYGRLESPDAPEFQHLREVTYISGASIIIHKALFNELGGFDERYKPAYYEDTDLAFSVREIGQKVYYQPLSKVIHFEGISSGTDLNAGTKKYQVVNQQKFLDKWQQALRKQPEPNSDIELARFQNQSPRVLILDACTPTPDQDSGSLRMMNLMQIFIDLGYHVSFIPENMAHFDTYTKQLQRLGVACIYAPKYSTPVDYLKAKGKYFDRVILSRYYVAEPVMSMIRSYCPAAKIWFDTVDLHYLRETRMAELENDEAALKSAQQTKQKEYGVAKACDLTLVVSPYEQQVIKQEDPALDVAVLSNIHAVYGGHVGFEASQDIMFIGGYQHTPNVDGIVWFVNDILPKICAEIPTLKLHIIGSKAPQQVIDLGQHPHVEFHGFVNDIEPLMQNIRIAVAPLRFGAGVKGKVNMSMSYGQPVVGTNVAVEGMYTTNGQDVMMADDASGFAAAVIKLYQDQQLWEQVSSGGLENVEKWFSFKAAKNTIAHLLDQY